MHSGTACRLVGCLAQEVEGSDGLAQSVLLGKGLWVPLGTLVVQSVLLRLCVHRQGAESVKTFLRSKQRFHNSGLNPHQLDCKHKKQTVASS